MIEKRFQCGECDYLKCIAVSKQMYFCNHNDRTDDMGKLTEDNLREDSPVWCPLKEKAHVR